MYVEIRKKNSRNSRGWVNLNLKKKNLAVVSTTDFSEVLRVVLHQVFFQFKGRSARWTMNVFENLWIKTSGFYLLAYQEFLP